LQFNASTMPSAMNTTNISLNLMGVFIILLLSQIQIIEKLGSESYCCYATAIRTSFSGIAYLGQHDYSASQSPARTSQSNTARQMKPALGRAVTASIYLPQKNR